MVSISYLVKQIPVGIGAHARLAVVSVVVFWRLVAEYLLGKGIRKFAGSFVVRLELRGLVVVPIGDWDLEVYGQIGVDTINRFVGDCCCGWW